MPAISEILVDPASWYDASDANRDFYERRAKDLGIYLAVDSQSSAEGRGVVVLVRDGNYVSETYALGARCPRGRPAWEHVLRRALNLDDPCF